MRDYSTTWPESILLTRLWAFRTERIERKESDISAAASSANNITAFAEKYYEELVDQLKALYDEKKTLQAERRELQRSLAGGLVLQNLKIIVSFV